MLHACKLPERSLRLAGLHLNLQMRRAPSAAIVVTLAALIGTGTTGLQFDSVIVPGERVGPIAAATSAEALSRVFGEGAVAPSPYYIGEGFCVPGTVAFAGTPDELEIAWQDDAQTRVAAVRMSTPGGRWATRSGIRVGTTLEALQLLNDGPFTFSGFGWDYGGGLSSWEDGRLDAELSDGIGLRLDADNEAASGLGIDYAVIHGEQLVRSDHPVARRAGIRVTDITVTFGPLPEEAFCG